MSEEATTCPACGHESRDAEWCDNCGAPLGDDANRVTPWLDAGSAVHVSSGDARAKVEIDRAIDTFATRRVLFGRIVEAGGSLEEHVETRVLIEEKEEPEDGPIEIPESLGFLFRTPLAKGKYGKHSVRIYEDTGALTIEDLSDITGGDLSYNQIRDIFTAVLEAVQKAHDAGYLILAIAPWTIRVDGALLPEEPEVPVTDPLDATEDITLEAARPDQAAIDAAVAEASQEMSSASDVSDSEDEDEDEDEGEFATSEIPELDPDATVADAPPDVEEEDSGEEDSGDEDVDDGWDALDDSEVESQTGVLPSRPPKKRPRAFFEGIDDLIEIDEEPYEVPVIMGFSPPELLGRVRADVGPHCDVFALGMLLYYLVAGRVPPASVYTRYTPAIPARNFRPGFPPGLQSVIGRATRPSPDERYTSVAAMKESFLSACSAMERRGRTPGGPASPRAIVAVDTHVGIAKGRRNPVNQDSVFARLSDDGRFGLVVVADGVSTASYGSGDLASHFLTDAAEAAWDEILPRYLMDERIDEVEIISKILEEANQDIVDYVNEHHHPFGGNPHEVMGTTSLVAVVREGITTIASLGDSRVYLQTTAGLEQITADHNLWTLSVIDGISADAALSMPHGDALARCLGTFVVDGDTLQSVPPEADYFRLTLARGDTLLLTTDGLIDFAGANPLAAEENVQAVMVSEAEPALACLELILLANRGGGGDNIGVGIIHFI